MKSDSVHIYEVRDGKTVLGRFLKKTPAEKRKKELKRAGRKVTLVSLFTRKYIPLEPEKIPKGMEYWKGTIPHSVPSEVARELEMGWENISDTFYIGSYRKGEPCLPNDRDADLSIQPNGDELVLCYHSFNDGKSYLILGRVDCISVTEDTVSVSGRIQDNRFVTIPFEIEGSRKKQEPKRMIFDKGWYEMRNGTVLYIGENDPKVLEEQHSRHIAAMLRYVIIYPGLWGDDYLSEDGFLPVRDGQTLDSAAMCKFNSHIKGKIGMDDPKKIADAFTKKKVGKMNEMISAYPECERIGTILKRERNEFQE